jgi:hypothetical protein
MDVPEGLGPRVLPQTGHTAAREDVPSPCLEVARWRAALACVSPCVWATRVAARVACECEVIFDGSRLVASCRYL